MTGRSRTPVEKASSRLDVEATVAALCADDDQANAFRIVTLEQKRAKRARSRKRYGFWAAVATQLAVGLSDRKVPLPDLGARREN
jgi:hypothetical protein